LLFVIVSFGAKKMPDTQVSDILAVIFG